MAYALILVFLNTVLPGVPFSLGLCFSMLVCGTNIVVTPALYVLASIVGLDWVTMLISLFEGGFLTAICLIYRKTGKKIKLEAAAYILIALAPFVAFSRWRGIATLYFTDNPYAIKAVAALAVAAFSFFAFRSVYALLYRLYRCKLRQDELLCLAVLFATAGTGLCNLVGFYAYLCVAAGICAFFIRLQRGPSAVITSCIAALPIAAIRLSLTPITAFFIISVAALIFCGAGRCAPFISCTAATAAYMYLEGLYGGELVPAILYTLLLAACCAASAIPSEKYMDDLRDRLEVRKVSPRAREERYREYVSEKLYKMSEVFREIESAFNALDVGPDEGAVKRRMLEETTREMCSDCKKRASCKGTRVYGGFAKLIEVGCLKGKVSLVDLTADVTMNCSSPAALIDTVNRLLYEYRKMTLEAENAKSGRKLLSGQARGIAEVLKSRAVEFCRDGGDWSALEKKISEELAAHGVSCPEISVSSQPETEISATIVGCEDFAPVKRLIEDTIGTKLILTDKKVYDADKSAYILTKPPTYDAAFGVAFAIKDGEGVSGDTHSVIKINEHAFLMALSDGMGSGEYARKVSSTAISLIEAFYRSEIPTDIVLDTINKLLCFNRDERFTCIDCAAIDLNTLTASFIKIGAPVAIIVRKGEIKVLESHSLPLGILDNLHPATAKEQLKKDDVVVFMSDGVTSSFGGTAELYDFIGRLKPLNPQSLAEKILAAAKEKVAGTPDDMTVLCVRIFEK